MSEQEVQTKDLKVRLPHDYHMKLQTLKILKGKNMSVAFCEALDMYFAEHMVARKNAPTAATA